MITQALEHFVITFLVGGVITSLLLVFFGSTLAALFVIFTSVATMGGAILEFMGHIQDDLLLIPIGILFGGYVALVVSSKVRFGK